MIAWLINIPNSLPSSLHPRVWGLLENFNYFDSTKQGKEKSLGWYTFIYNAVQCTQECIRVAHNLILIYRKIQNDQSIIKINTADAIFKQLLLVVVFDFFFRNTCGTKIASIDHSGNFKNNVVLSHICELL